MFTITNHPDQNMKVWSIVILQPEKGNGVVVLDQIQYDNVIKNKISDNTKI